MTTIDLSDPSPRSHLWRSLALWTIGVFVYAGVLSLQVGLPFTWALRSAVVYVYALGIVTIPIRLWSRRAMARSWTPARAAGFAVLSVLTVAAWMGIDLLYNRLTIGPRFWQVVYRDNWLFQLLFAIMAFGAVMGITLAAHAWQRERERERREADLTILAREAELGAIRAQFQPHFVLNALNSLLALINTDPALARTMVVRLADVMKAVFERIDLPAVPLERELELVKAYLDVERIRFGSRLSVTFEIEDAARGVMVPPFLLQPIVENAVKHGVAPFSHPGFVHIVARVSSGQLEVDVRDSGAGTLGTTPGGTGVGLQLTRRRLDAAYGGGYELTLDRQPTGTSVRIVTPADAAHVA
jgi:two-component system, LytTR family, sensor kinase